MLDTLTSFISNALNRRGSSLSVPILDGAFKPNNLLEQAEVLAEREGLEDMALAADGRLLAACGRSIVEVSGDGTLGEVASFDGPVTALAVMADGSLAVALGDRVVVVDPAGTGSRTVERAGGQPFKAVTALEARPDGALLICDASARRPCDQWRHDLMEKGRSGRLVRWERSGGEATVLAAGLGYAFGSHVDAQGRVLVSESWRHQVSDVADGHAKPGIPALAGYPARMAAAEGGGFWLTLFACRTQLVEFVLQEDDYRSEMMKTMAPELWVSPAFSSGADFREPLQAGGVKQMGILKPWAPPRSYGLVVRYNSELIPVYSLHSRVGGDHHGIAAVAQRGDELLVLSKGAGRILRLSVSEVEAQGTSEAAS